uniref:Uncharacterized protein n=1 Tax=Oryza punctata TaxID=4537 RepID=A0A0E0JXC0_ORYPU
MGSYTNLYQDNIMVADYGKLPEANRQAFETHLEGLRFEKTLDARMNKLENWLNSRLLGTASTSYNSEHLYGVSSAYNLPSVPIQHNWSMRSTYNSLNMVDPKIISAEQYAGQTAAILPVRPQSMSLLGLAPTSVVPSNPMTSTRPKLKSLSDEIAEAFKIAFGVDTRIKKDPFQESQAKEAEISQKAKSDPPHDNVVDKAISPDNKIINMQTAEWARTSKSEPFICSILKPVVHKNRHGETKFTFDVAKCDNIFDYLLEHKQIELSQGHVIQPSVRTPVLQQESHVYFVPFPWIK